MQESMELVFGQIRDNIMGSLWIVAPIATGIVGVAMAWSYATRLFKHLTKVEDYEYSEDELSDLYEERQALYDRMEELDEEMGELGMHYLESSDDGIIDGNDYWEDVEDIEPNTFDDIDFDDIDYESGYETRDWED